MYLHRNHVIGLYAHNALSHVMSNRGSHFAICHEAITYRMIYSIVPSPFLHEGSKEGRIKANRLFSLSLSLVFSLFLSREYFSCLRVYRGYSPKRARHRCTKKSISSVATTGGTRHRKTVLAQRQFGDPSDWRSFLKSRGPVDSSIARAYSTRERNAVGDNASFFLFFPAGWLACNESRGWINCDSSVVFQYITTQGVACNEVIPSCIPFVVAIHVLFFFFF